MRQREHMKSRMSGALTIETRVAWRSASRRRREASAAYADVSRASSCTQTVATVATAAGQMWAKGGRRKGTDAADERVRALRRRQRPPRPPCAGHVSSSCPMASK